MLPFLRSQTKHRLVHNKTFPLCSSQLKVFVCVCRIKTHLNEGNKKTAGFFKLPFMSVTPLFFPVSLHTGENSLKHIPSVEIIIVSVWWWGLLCARPEPTACQITAHSHVGTDRLSDPRCHSLYPSGPPAPRKPTETHSQKTSYRGHH